MDRMHALAMVAVVLHLGLIALSAPLVGHCSIDAANQLTVAVDFAARLLIGG